MTKTLRKKSVKVINYKYFKVEFVELFGFKAQVKDNYILFEIISRVTNEYLSMQKICFRTNFIKVVEYPKK
jgi:hypothetical protein